MTPDRERTAARRAERLLRWYPATWRARYGEEFGELLIDDISERPRSWVRTADVIRSGALARLASAGLVGQALEPERQVRAGLAWLVGALAGFLTLGIAIWSELTIGWQWSAPAAPATRVGMLVMSAAILGFVIVAVLAAIPIVWSVGAGIARSNSRGLGHGQSPGSAGGHSRGMARGIAGGNRRSRLAPIALATVGATAFALGSVHFGHGWPGTGGHPWAGRGLVPGSVARFCWAATLWVTSYWAHPSALSSFPAAELTWMAVSPLALAATATGAALTLRRTPLPPKILRYEAWLGAAAALTMTVFLAGAGSWVISGGPAPRGLFRVGAIDGVGLAVMTAALVLAFRALRRALPAASRCRA